MRVYPDRLTILIHCRAGSYALGPRMAQPLLSAGPRVSLRLIPELAMGVTNIAADPAKSLGVERVFLAGISTVWGTKLRMHL